MGPPTTTAANVVVSPLQPATNNSKQESVAEKEGGRGKQVCVRTTYGVCIVYRRVFRVAKGGGRKRVAGGGRALSIKAQKGICLLAR